MSDKIKLTVGQVLWLERSHGGVPVTVVSVGRVWAQITYSYVGGHPVTAWLDTTDMSVYRAIGNRAGRCWGRCWKSEETCRAWKATQQTMYDNSKAVNDLCMELQRLSPKTLADRGVTAANIAQARALLGLDAKKEAKP